jgi:hypothetical protein
MTPKEKALELVDKFTNLYEGINLGLAKKHWAKQSVLIAVDEILNNWKDEASIQFPYGKVITYWNIVKEEIEEL